jgi:hypothetical protein
MGFEIHAIGGVHKRCKFNRGDRVEHTAGYQRRRVLQGVLVFARKELLKNELLQSLLDGFEVFCHCESQSLLVAASSPYDVDPAKSSLLDR